MKNKFSVPLVVAALVLAIALIYIAQNPGQILSKIKPGQNTNVNTGEIKDIPALGNSNAKVLVEVYSDYQCPFCGRYYVDSIKPFIKDYVDTGKAKLIYRELAFEGDRSQWAAEATRCANDQGKFWEYHDKIFTERFSKNDTSVYEKASLKQYAKDLGLDTNLFNACLDSGKYTQAVKDATKAGFAKGINGTPTTIINGKSAANEKGEPLGAMDYQTLKSLVEAAL